MITLDGMPHHKSMIPPGFTPPHRVVTDHFVVRPLLSADAEPDFEAWSTSLEHLRGLFGPSSDWPTSEMTLEENVIDLAWHQREHEVGSSFAFTVLDIDEERCLGCIYFNPAQKVGYEVECFYWVRATDVALDGELGAFIDEWLETWPFESVVLPGRNTSWDEYSALPDQPHW